jgi:hypothetical protein
MRKFLSLLILLCFVGGCSSVPFVKTEYGVINNASPADILDQHIALTPESFKIVNTVVFQFRTRKFLSLGYLSVDIAERAFELAGMNSMGIKLIEIAAKDKEVTVNNVIDEISKRGDIAKVLVADIDRIYFDQTPVDDARISVKEKEVVFSQDEDGERTDFIFAGKGNHLIEKARYKGKKKIWSVEYYEYENKDGKIYPQGIIYKNHLHKYKLIMSTKEII